MQGRTLSNDISIGYLGIAKVVMGINPVWTLLHKEAQKELLDFNVLN